MSTPSLTSLLVQRTRAQIYAIGLEVATSVGLTVTSWVAGDPTRSAYHFLAEALEVVEGVVVNFIAAGFLDYVAARAELAGTDSAAYQWLKLLAWEQYGYEVDEATYATTTVTLTNGGGGYYEPEAGDITLKSSLSGMTYRNTSGGVLASGPGTTLDVTVVADEAGSESSAGAGEIDTLVTTMLEVTCSNAAAAIGIDAETPASVVTGCRAKLGPLSPNGPWDAYDSIATDADKTGTTNVTKSRTYADSTTGDVTQYLAGPSGAVTGPDVTAVEEAIATWVLPLCITPTIASAANKAVAITYELWLYDSVGQTEAEVKATVQAALEIMFSQRPIGGDVKAAVGSGYLYVEMIRGTIKAAFLPQHFVDVAVSLPAADVAIAEGEIAALSGTPTATVHFEAAP